MDRGQVGRVAQMVALRHLISGFLAGEIDPLLSGRVDSDQYTYGLSTCENFVCVNEGPLVKRPGFEYICDAAPTASWLGAFRFSITQEYAIEWSALKARFYTNGGRIETAPNVPYELATPYAAAAAPKLSLQQSYDRLYVDHPTYPPGALARTSAITFSHTVTTLKNGPFLDPNSDTTKTVTVAGVLTLGGAVTITASSGIFAATDVGAQFRVQLADFSTIKAWEPGMNTIAIGEIVRSEGKAYTAATAGTTGSVVPTHSEGSEWDGQSKIDAVNLKGPYGVQWTYRHDRFAVIEIAGFTSATAVTGTVKRRVPDMLTTVASHRWAHGAFSATRGWPGIVLHAFGRQIHFKDLDVIASAVGDFGGGQCNFETLTSSGITAADLGFRRTLAESDPPLWATADLKKLLIGTASRELAIGAINSAAAVAGDNLSAEPQSFYGCEAVQPAQIGTQTVFVERGGRRLRAGGYDFAQDRYGAADLTAGARHITMSGIVQLAWQRAPNQLLHAVRSDGQLAVHALTRLEVKGFARTVLANGAPATAARALSAVAVMGADGKTDELWLLVERTRADGLKREIWRQTAWRELGDDPAEQFFVDAGVRTAAAGGQTVFTGAVHLAGAAIAVLVNGAVVPGIAVDGAGAFTLPALAVPAAPYVLMIGLPYTALAVTLRPERQLRSGTIQGLLKRVRKAALRLLESAGISVGAPAGALEELDLRPGSAAMDAPIPLFSGDSAGSIEMDFDRDGKVRFVSDKPLAATIAAAVLSMEVDENDA